LLCVEFLSRPFMQWWMIFELLTVYYRRKQLRAQRSSYSPLSQKPTLHIAARQPHLAVRRFRGTCGVQRQLGSSGTPRQIIVTSSSMPSSTLSLATVYAVSTKRRSAVNRVFLIPMSSNFHKIRDYISHWSSRLSWPCPVRCIKVSGNQ
jgi:hypothetical protein